MKFSNLVILLSKVIAKMLTEIQEAIQLLK